jgi:predicted nucleotidyltransferase
MKHEELVSALRDLAERTNANFGRANWYLFGSAQKDLSYASDIDLLVVCATHDMADAIRQAVDVDKLSRPIHLSILTQAEEAEVRFVKRQSCIQVV